MDVSEIAFACTVKLYDIWKVTNVLIKSVWYVTKYIICCLKFPKITSFLEDYGERLRIIGVPT